MAKAVILCVDDEDFILKSLKIQLKSAFADRYSYETAENAHEAMDVIEECYQQNTPVIVIVSDWLMPGLRGDEFLIQVHTKHPEIVKILLTGQADEEAVSRATQKANLHCCLRKPWQMGELIEAIQGGIRTVH